MVLTSQEAGDFLLVNGWLRVTHYLGVGTGLGIQVSSLLEHHPCLRLPRSHLFRGAWVLQEADRGRG